MGKRKGGLKVKDTRIRCLLKGIALLTAFALWTVLIKHIDVQNAGPNGTEIGFASATNFVEQVIICYFFSKLSMLNYRKA